MEKRPSYEELEERIKKLEKAEEELDRIFELSPDLVGAANLNAGYFTRVNPAWEIFGRPLEEFIERPFLDLIHPDDQNATAHEVEAMQSGQSVFGFENRYRCKNGSYRTIEWRATSAQADGIAYVAGRDITERKQAETALMESEAKYRQIFENIQDVYYETSLDGKILEISPSIQNISQYTRKDVMGKSLFDIYADPEQRKEFVKIILEKNKVNDFELTLKDKDGSQHPCSVVAVLIKDDQGNPIKIVGSLRDIFDRKQAEKEKEKLQNQLQQAYKMEAIGTLAGGIAHDFNNILSSVIGFTELALDDVEKGTQLEDNLQDVYKAGKRAKDLVKQILTFARQANEELKPIKVKTIAKEALKLIRSTIPTTIEIRQNIESDSLIMGNATSIHQIFMNLCTNAEQAMETDGGILEVSLKDVTIDRNATMPELALKAGNFLKVTISDTGTGMAPDIIGSIFEPYFTTKELGEGTGMGLAMVHGIVKSWDGEITVESKVGKGTVFTVCFPIIQDGLEAKPYPKEALPSGTERILFIDDELSIAKSSSLILQGLGYKVTTRTSGIEALELFRSKPNDFDLVITDMTMPNMRGDMLAVELMKIRPDIPVILCTGYSKTISDDSATAIGIKAFAYKPILKSDLAKIVRKVLDGKIEK